MPGPGSHEVPGDDPFGTAVLRHRVLAAWNDSPARLREDANAEEDAALGSYRDRLVVELAQNAADAAAQGVPGRLLLRLLDDPDGGPGRLLAANTGAPLSADGVQGLATLRASAKRDPDGAVVGRFGVGFSAVLAVCDEPAIRSADGAVRFSRTATAQLLRSTGAPGAVAEVERRGGHVPALRLPFPAPDATAVPTGYDTVVDLPLRDGAARELVHDLLTGLVDGAGDVLLLALPALAEIVVEVPGSSWRIADVDERWRIVRRSGRHDPAHLADRGAEDRDRIGWQLAWALPTPTSTPTPTPTSTSRSPGVVCAPTPTDEDLPWPALLVATFPLGPDRRRLAPGPATDALLDAAAQAYGDLLAEVAADGGDALDLLPYGVAAGRIDAELRQRVLERARDVPLLLCVERVDGAPLPVRPSSAVALSGPGADDPALLAALAPVLAGLVAVPRGTDRLLTELGVPRMGLADVLDLLSGLDAAGSLALFAALAPLATDPVAREAMSGLPVPLLDGRRVHGARGTVLLDGPGTLDSVAAQLFAEHGLRVVDPAAATGPARELLVRLGAREGGAWAVLTDPALRAAVAASPDADDPDALAAAVLDVVAVAVTGANGDDGAREAQEESVLRLVQDLPWLADLALPDAEDDLVPAGALLLPGTLAERCFAADDVAPVAPDVLQEWGSAVLRAVGVLTGPAVAVLPEVDLTDPQTAADLGLAGFEDYVEEVWADVLDDPAEGTLAVGIAGGPAVVRDLDLVVDAWPQVLTGLAGSVVGLRALTEPWIVGRHRRQGPAAWWLRRHGPLPEVSRSPGNEAGDGSGSDWLPAAPAWAADLPDPVRTALGVLPDLSAATAEDLPALLRLCGRERPSAVGLLTLWAALGRLAAHPVPQLVPPVLQRLAALDADGTVVLADAADVVVADSAAWAQRTDLGPRILVPAASAVLVADLLDVDLASDRAGAVLEHPVGSPRPVPAAVGALVPLAPPTWTEVPSLRCDGVGVDFWVREDLPGQVRVIATSVEAAGRGLAQAGGRWSSRAALTRLLTGEDPAVVLAEELPGLGD